VPAEIERGVPISAGRRDIFFQALDGELGQIGPTHHLGPELSSMLKKNHMGLP